MKQMIVMLGLIFSLMVESFGQTHNSFAFSLGMGLPVGKSSYPENSYYNASLFSNKLAFNAGIDYILKTNQTFGYGISAKFNFYSGWRLKNVSDRFANSSLRSFDLGPALYLNINSLSNKKKTNRILVVPFISCVSLTNHDSIYSLISDALSNSGQPGLSTMQMKENYTHITQFLPGIHLAFDWALYINERSLIIIRPGFTFMFTKTGAYPDKYMLMPSISIGYAFDNKRDKWYYLNESK